MEIFRSIPGGRGRNLVEFPFHSVPENGMERTSIFKFLSKNVVRSIILVKMNDLSLSIFDNDFVYWNRSLVGETVYTERIISC